MAIRYFYAGKGYSGRPDDERKYGKDFLLALYRSMLRIRRVEEEIERRYCEDQMKTPIHLVLGQEAVAVGACAALERRDQIWLSHRTHGHYLAKGGSLKAMMAEMFCRINGCVGSRGGSMHLVDKSAGVAGTSAIVGGNVPLAAGAALAAAMKKQQLVNVAFFGDAATEEGAVCEVLNFAVLKRLPVVFFCENNFYSVCSPLAQRQPPVEIWQRAAGFGLPSVLVDGTNVLAVYEAMLEAAERARSGCGPSFVEAKACRYRGHGGAGDDSHTGYRDPEEVRDWMKKADPLESFGRYLRNLDILNAEIEAELEQCLHQEIKEAFDYALASPEPTEADLTRFVYSD